MNKKIILLLILNLFSNYTFSFKLGVENIPDEFFAQFAPTKMVRLGIITNQTGCDTKGRPTYDLLQKYGTVTAIFSPEHGFDGTCLAGKEVFDAKHGIIQIRSLYGNGTGKKIDPRYLKEIDVLVFDMQDSGMRHYTYISTLFYMLQSAAENNKPIIILDRPNPLGAVAEGPLVEPQLHSFISIAPIPLRHGMTIGEIARYFNIYLLKEKASLFVIPMEDYNRQSMNKLITKLSPNLTSIQSCYGYSFLGLLGEIEPFDVGVGTPLAFQCITTEKKYKINWEPLKAVLQKHGISATDYKYYNKRKNQQLYGLSIDIHDIDAFCGFKVLVELINFFKKSEIKLTTKHSFCKAVGTHEVEEFMNGRLSLEQLQRSINTQLQTFYKHMRPALIYHKLPRLFNL